MPFDQPSLQHEYNHGDPLAWAGLVVILGTAYLAARLVTWLAMAVALRRWRRAGGEHWTERARLAWPGRRLAALTPFIVPIPLLFAFLFPTPLLLVFGREPKYADLLPSTVANLLFLAVGLVGVLQARFGWERQVNPALALTPRPWRAAWISGAVLFALWVWLAFSLLSGPLKLGSALELAVMAGFILALLAYQTWGWMAVMRCLGIIRPASNRWRVIVAAVGERMAVRPKAVEEIALPMANAFAFVFHRGIGVTDAALAVLGDDELSAVAAHELAHLGEPRRVRLARSLPGLVLASWLSSPWAFGSLDRTFGLEGGLVALLGADIIILLALVGYSRLHHRMELRADAMAARLETMPGTYARALERLYATNLAPVVMRALRGEHPELYDRMSEAGLPPEYPRPAPPPQGPFYLGLLVLILGAIVSGFGLDWLANAIQ